MRYFNMDKVLFKERKTKQIKRTEGLFENSKVISITVNVVLIVVSGFLVFNSIRSFQIARQKLVILEQANKEVNDLRLRNISLILDKSNIETDDYTETDIRNRLNYSKKGDTVFVISDESLALSKMQVDNILAPKAFDAVQKSTYQQWLDFFMYGI